MDNGIALMFYDGLCGFCNGTVKWVLAHDRQDKFRFAPQQSLLAEQILSRHGVSREEMISSNSVYLVLSPDRPEEKLLLRSDVLVDVLKLLGGGWSWLGKVMAAIPRPLRDAGYTLVANNRYRIGKRLDSCPLPSPKEKSKFLGL